MGADLSAMVIGFADRTEASKDANRAIHELTGITVDSSRPSREQTKSGDAIRERNAEIFGLRLGFDYLTPHIVIHSLRRWNREDASTYEAFVVELRELFSTEEIVLMSDYDVNWLEGTDFTVDELRTNPRFIQIP